MNFEDSKPIPGTTCRYSITRDGVVYNVSKRKPIKVYMESWRGRSGPAVRFRPKRGGPLHTVFVDTLTARTFNPELAAPWLAEENVT